MRTKLDPELSSLLTAGSNHGVPWDEIIPPQVADLFNGRVLTIPETSEKYTEGGCLIGPEAQAPGLLAHQIMTGETFWWLAVDGQKSTHPLLQTIDPRLGALIGLVHDHGKLPGSSREELSVESKRALLLPDDYGELTAGEDDKRRLIKLEFPDEVVWACHNHDFPQGVPDLPPQLKMYFEGLVIADYMSWQREVTDWKTRYNDIEVRWDVYGANPRIPPDKFEIAGGVIGGVSDKYFGVMGPHNFIEQHKLAQVEPSGLELFLKEVGQNPAEARRYFTASMPGSSREVIQRVG